MPRIPRNPGSGKRPVNTPARGLPATGSHGPGKGPGHPGWRADPLAQSAGKDVAADIRARIAARKGELLDAQFDRALNLKHPHGHAAAADLLDRIAPKTAKHEIAGDGGGPVVIRRVIVDPRGPADA